MRTDQLAAELGIEVTRLHDLCRTNGISMYRTGGIYFLTPAAADLVREVVTTRQRAQARPAGGDAEPEPGPRYDVADRVEWDHPAGHGMFEGSVIEILPDLTYRVLVLGGPGNQPFDTVAESALRPLGTRVAYNRITDRLGRGADVAQECGRSAIEIRARELLDALADAGETDADVQAIVRALAPAEPGDRR